MRYILVGLIVVSVPFGLILSGNIFKLGLEQSLELYGTTFTIISGLSLLPLFLCIAALVDKRSGPPRR